jgi:hypothetical protein
VSESLLTVLKICLLVLLYLFFFRVIRAVWAELKSPPPADVVPAAERRRRRPARVRTSAPLRQGEPQLVVVEPPEQRGRSYVVVDELTVGRAASCRILVEDSFVSQLHARVYTKDGQLLVEDLGSTNGTYLNRQRVQGPMVMQRGDRLQVGNTVMELA